MMISNVSSSCWIRADSSMPRKQIHDITRIQSTQPTSAAPLWVSAQVQPNSLNVYVAAMNPRDAITSTSARKIAQPLIHPNAGPNARVVQANVVPASGSALFR